MVTKKIFNELLSGRIIKKEKMTRYGIRKDMFVLKEGDLYSNSTFDNYFDNTWVKCNVFDLKGYFEIIEGYDLSKDKFIN